MLIVSMCEMYIRYGARSKKVLHTNVLQRKPRSDTRYYLLIFYNLRAA